MITSILQAVGFGLVTSAILALATVAVGLQFSVTNIPNFAHGDVMTVGAFAAYTTGFFINNAVIQAVAAIIFGAIAAYLINKGLLQPFKRAGARNIVLVIVTLSASLILQNILLAIFGGSEVFYKFPNSAPVHVGPFLWTSNSILIMIAAAIMVTGVWAVLRYTRFGKAQRAVSDDVDLARVTGIESSRIIDLTWIWAGGMAGLAGFVLAVEVGAFTNTLGFTYLFIIFASSVVGGIGSLPGALLGSLLIGLGMEVSAVWIPGDYKQTFALVALIVVLLLRPSGIFASRIRNVVDAV